MGLAARPGRARPDRPQRPRDPARHRTPNAAPDRNRRLGIGVGDGGFPAGGAGCAVSLCRRRVDVLTEPTGGPFFSCHFHAGRRPGLGADRTAGAGGRGHERGADARGDGRAGRRHPGEGAGGVPVAAGGGDSCRRPTRPTSPKASATSCRAASACATRVR